GFARFERHLLETIAVDDGTAPRAENVDPGNQSVIGCRCREEVADRAVFKLQRSHGNVLDFNPLMRPGTGLSIDPLDITGQPLEYIQRMHALVHQCAPTVPSPGAAPVARIIIFLRTPPLHRPLDQDNLAELPGVDGLLDNAGSQVKAMLGDN